MGRILYRLESGERWWAAEIIVRSLGLVLLGLCAFAAIWLYGSMHLPPPHDARPLEYGAALLTFLSWTLGCAFALEGPGLFKLIAVPGRFVIQQRKRR